MKAALFASPQMPDLGRLAQYLVERLADHRAVGEWRVRERLGLLGAHAVPALTAALEHRELAVRRIAAQLLGKAGTAAAKPALLQALLDDDAETRFEAARALATLGDVAAVGVLLDFMRHGLPWMRWHAVEALAPLEHPVVLPALQLALSHPDWNLSGYARTALASVGVAAVPFVVEAAHSPVAAIRSSALQTLGDIGDERGAPLAREALLDDEASVRAAALTCLAKTAGRGALGDLVPMLADDDRMVRARACYALAELGVQAAVPALIERGMRDRDEFVRAAAAEALGRIGDGRATLSLVDAMWRDTSGQVRRRCIRALGGCGDPGAAEELRRFLRRGLFTVYSGKDRKQVRREGERSLRLIATRGDRWRGPLRLVP